MALDLETLRKEMQAHLEESGMPVFYGYHRMLRPIIHAAWDTEGHPDFREFLDTASKAGAKLVLFNQESFELNEIDEALENLEGSDLSREEKRHFETRLKQLQAYEGFTCSLQLSFTLEGHIYLYELSTDWFDALQDVLNELGLAAGPFDGDEEGETGPMGGHYFSNN